MCLCGAASAQQNVMTLSHVDGRQYVHGMSVLASPVSVCGTFSRPDDVRSAYIGLANTDGSTRRMQRIPTNDGKEFCTNLVLDRGRNTIVSSYESASSGSQIHSAYDLYVESRSGNPATSALRIDLTWDSESDLDLHIYSPSSPGSSSTMGDHGSRVYYGNPATSWACLDIDAGVDTLGFGPESITVNEWPLSGDYLVVVEKHADNGVARTNGIISFYNGASRLLHRQAFQLDPTRERFIASSVFVSAGGNVAIQGVGNIDAVLGPTLTDPNQLPAAPTLAQAHYVANDGRLADMGVAVSISGTLGKATLAVELDVAVPGGAPLPGGHGIYVAALVPGRQLGTYEPFMFSKLPSGDWAPLAVPLPAYLAADAGTGPLLRLELLREVDLTRLTGTELYIGVGLGSDEMLASKRYRGVYKILPR